MYWVVILFCCCSAVYLRKYCYSYSWDKGCHLYLFAMYSMVLSVIQNMEWYDCTVNSNCRRCTCIKKQSYPNLITSGIFLEGEREGMSESEWP
jgi:hypothetical protein